MLMRWAGRALCELGLHWMGDVETVPWVRGQNALVVDCTRDGCPKRTMVGLIPAAPDIVEGTARRRAGGTGPKAA